MIQLHRTLREKDSTSKVSVHIWAQAQSNHNATSLPTHFHRCFQQNLCPIHWCRHWMISRHGTLREKDNRRGISVRIWAQAKSNYNATRPVLTSSHVSDRTCVPFTDVGIEWFRCIEHWEREKHRRCNVSVQICAQAKSNHNAPRPCTHFHSCLNYGQNLCPIHGCRHWMISLYGTLREKDIRCGVSVQIWAQAQSNHTMYSLVVMLVTELVSHPLMSALNDSTS